MVGGVGEVGRYWLHFVGKSIYGTDRFIREAKKLGVSRAISWPQLVKIAEDGWGTIVLLAEHRRVKEGDKEVQGAVVFGYFRVSGINIPHEVSEELKERIKIIREVGGGFSVNRACGSYYVSSSYQVDETLKDLVEKIKEVCKDMKINPLTLKIFITGRLTTFDSPVILRNQEFFRGFKKVEIEGLEIPTIEAEKEPFLVFIKDYQRRRYLRKKERDMFDHLILDEWLRQGKSMPEPV